MSSHLRHCPKHKKPLPCPHCAMIQKPVAPEAAPETPKRIGRPPKHGVAMTAAERKRAQRERERWEIEGPERKKLVLAIRKRIKTSEHTNIAAMLRALSEFDEALDHTTLDQLRDIAKSYRLIHDQKGRRSFEGHTGGKDIERIDAAVHRDTQFGGRKPKTGASPNVDHEFPTAPPNKRSTSSSLAREERATGIRWNDLTKTLWDCIPEITERMFIGDEDDFSAEYDPDKEVESTLVCRACKADALRGDGDLLACADWFEARQHVEEMIKKGEAQLQYIKLLEEVSETAAHYEDALSDARKLYNEKYGSHHWWAVILWQETKKALGLS